MWRGVSVWSIAAALALAGVLASSSARVLGAPKDPPALGQSPDNAESADDAEATARLAWVRGPGAESCATGLELQKDVSRRLGRDAFAEPASRTIEGTVA